MTRTGKAIAALAAMTVAFEPGALASHHRHRARGTVFVTERQLGSVTAFDAASGEVLWTAAVGASPIGGVQPRGTDKVYTSDEGADQMTVLDRRTGAWLATIPMDRPHHLCHPDATSCSSTIRPQHDRRSRHLPVSAGRGVVAPPADARTHASGSPAWKGPRCHEPRSQRDLPGASDATPAREGAVQHHFGKDPTRCSSPRTPRRLRLGPPGSTR